MWGSAKRAPTPLLWLAAIVVAAFSLVPLFYLGLRISDGGWQAFYAAISRPRAREAYGNTVALLAIVGSCATVMGVAMAYVIARIRLPFSRLWWVLAVLPLAVPSYVGAFALLNLFPHLHGLWPTALVLSLFNVPFVTVPALAAIKKADHNLVDVARTTGRGPIQVFMRVTLPQIAPAVASGALLVLLYTLSDFGTPSMLRYHTMTTGVYAIYTGTLNRSAAASVALVLALVAIAIVVLERWVRHSVRLHKTASRSRQVPQRELGRFGSGSIVLCLVAVFLVSVVIPVVVLTRRMLTGTRYLDTVPDLARASLTTLLLGLMVALAATLLALPIAILSAKHRSKAVAALEVASFTGHALPGLVVALSLVFFGTTVMRSIYQTNLLLIACLVILFLPKAIGSARAGIAQVPPVLVDTARSLGRSPIRAWWSVVARGAMPGIVAGAVLVMVAAMKELPATLMLRPAGMNTLATELWSLTSIGAYGAAAPIALLLIAVGSVPAILLAKVGNR